MHAGKFSSFVASKNESAVTKEPCCSANWSCICLLLGRRRTVCTSQPMAAASSEPVGGTMDFRLYYLRFADGGVLLTHCCIASAF